MGFWTTEEAWHGTKARPQARWKRDAYSNNVVAMRKAAQVAGDLKILQDMYPDTSLQCLTTTLPGAWHGIRSSGLVNQFNYMTERKTVSGYAGDHSMRGLNLTLANDTNVFGGWHFFECKYNSKKKWWNLHCHSLLFGDASPTIPLSSSDIPENDDDTDPWSMWNSEGGLQNKKLKSSTSGALRELGFGERYTLDQADSSAEQISYCTKLAYCTKQVLEGPENELVAFLRGRKPRLSEAFGSARLSKQDRIAYHFEHDNHEMVRQLSEKGIFTGTLSNDQWRAIRDEK
jgi:hypothetical protein